MTNARLGHLANRTVFYALLLALAATSAQTWAAEKKTFSGTGIFINISARQVGYEADNPKRDMAQWTAIWTFTSTDPDFDGIIETAPTQSICSPSGCRHQGQLVFHHKNGDESWGYFYGTHTITSNSDGSWAFSTEGQKVLVGGTGKFAHIKGVLKYTAKDVPFGRGFNWTGEVEY